MTNGERMFADLIWNKLTRQKRNDLLEISGVSGTSESECWKLAGCTWENLPSHVHKCLFLINWEMAVGSET